MPYKDPEKARENARLREARYRARHREKQNAAVRAWYERNKEKVLERLKKQYAADPEKYRERRRRYRERKKDAEGRRDEMAVKTASCPLCKSAGGAKVKGAGYVAGCLNRKCQKWIDGEEAFTNATLAGAIAAWEKWREEELAEQEEAKRLEAEMAAEAGEDGLVDVGDPDEEFPPDGDEDWDGDGAVELIAAPEDAGGDDGGGDDGGGEAAGTEGTTETAGTKEADEAEEDGGEGADGSTAPPERKYKPVTDEEVAGWSRLREAGWSWRQIALKYGRAESHIKRTLAKREAEQEEENEETGEMKETEDTEAAGESGETFARFWLELDGEWYWLAAQEDGEELCSGCEFSFAFGRRMMCAAAASEDFSMACELCKRLEGVWQKGEAGEE